MLTTRGKKYSSLKHIQNDHTFMLEINIYEIETINNVSGEIKEATFSILYSSIQHFFLFEKKIYIFLLHATSGTSRGKCFPFFFSVRLQMIYNDTAAILYFPIPTWLKKQSTQIYMYCTYTFPVHFFLSSLHHLHQVQVDIKSILKIFFSFLVFFVCVNF